MSRRSGSNSAPQPGSGGDRNRPSPAPVRRRPAPRRRTVRRRSQPRGATGSAAGASALLAHPGNPFAPHAFGGADPAFRGSDGALNPAASQPAAGSSVEVSAPPAVDPTEAAAEVTYQRGIVLAGSGTLDRREVFVEIYGNDSYGSQATVIVRQPGGHSLAATVDVAIEGVLSGEFGFDAQPERMTRGGFRLAMTASVSAAGSTPERLP
jgi:hypothetical protein